jgi:hypothetical protein
LVAHPIIPVTPKKSANITLIAHIARNQRTCGRYRTNAGDASNSSEIFCRPNFVLSERIFEKSPSPHLGSEYSRIMSIFEGAKLIDLNKENHKKIPAGDAQVLFEQKAQFK